MTDRILEQFDSRFGGQPSLYCSPGRINLIGEHTDYNMGFVLPGAIDKAIYVAVRPGSGPVSRIYSLDYDQTVCFAADTDHLSLPVWARYVMGVASEMRARGADVPPFDCVFGGDVPLGAGLSSSAALESAVGFALNDMFGLGFDRRGLATIGQMTEHNYVGVMCGIMDQFASLFGQAGKVIKLDCRSLECELVPFDPQGCRVVLVDSMVKHSLASSEYNVRRRQCEAGVAAVAAHVPGVLSLRDIDREMLDRYRGDMGEVAYRRCAYVVDENERLLSGVGELTAGDYAAFGRKMFASHDGLSRDYEVSCAELDFIVDIARGQGGVLGARMMGGGFGGCVIALVEQAACDAYLDQVLSRFDRQFGLTPRTIDVVVGDGARRLG